MVQSKISGVKRADLAAMQSHILFLADKRKKWYHLIGTYYEKPKRQSKYSAIDIAPLALLIRYEAATQLGGAIFSTEFREQNS